MSAHIPNVFYSICSHFFTEDGSKKRFKLPAKSSVVSDPFVEYLHDNVFVDVFHVVAPPHVCPDLAFFHFGVNDSVHGLFGLEVKTSKSKSGDINFNSTPPCGQVVVEVSGEDRTIPCYYLFAQLILVDKEFYEIGSMMMVDGDFINADFDLYLEATGIREKKIDLGSYGDGMDRQRPMFVFPNPLGIKGVRSERTTLITKYNDLVPGREDEITKVAHLRRQDGAQFYAYQAVRHLNGPFTKVTRRVETKERSKLKIESDSILNTG
jgi:hypothetical protein